MHYLPLYTMEAKGLEPKSCASRKAPAAIMIYANFMHRVGLLKVKPQTWKDAFMSELYGLPGSWSG